MPDAALTGTLMFTDIQGSTVLARELGDGFAELVAAHHRLLRGVFAEHGAEELRTEGDAFFLLFPTARQALDAAVAAQQALQAYPWPEGVTVRVRIGVHTGRLVVVDGEHVGLDIHRAARIAGTGHGGQIVASQETVTAAPAAPDEVVDLGLHWLKDLDEPEHLFQVVGEGLPSAFPPLRSLGTPMALPSFGTPLVGRTAERDELVAMVGGNSSRVVTLVGPGGVGKTRLAIGVAEAMTAEFPYGVYFVSLAEVAAPDAVPTAVAMALMLDPPEGDAAVADLAAHVRSRRMLLVLDNVEHVLGAAAFVATLLSDAAGPRVLCTSREPLRLRDEAEYAVPPLSVPGSAATRDDARRSDAVALFVERAAAVRRGLMLDDEDLDLVVEICRRLDGLPLAIELAASRMKVMAPDALLATLDRHLLNLAGPSDVPDRQQTLYATIDWSYELLPDAERRVLRWCSVFRGGFTAEAADAVMSEAAGDAVGVLEALVDKSLIQVAPLRGGTRVALLHTVAAYAWSHLGDDPERSSALARHARHYLSLAEATDLTGAAQAQGLALLDAEAGNLRAALDRAVESELEDSDDLGLRLARQLGLYWYRRGSYREGAERLEAALAAAEHGTPAHRAWALYRLGVLRSELDDVEGAQACLEEARTLAGRAGDRPLEAAIHNTLGVAMMRDGRLAQARTLLEESHRLRRELGDEPGMATALTNLASVAFIEGDGSTAAAILEECLAIDRRLGNRWGEAVGMLNLAAVRLSAGVEVEEANRLLTAALTIFSDVHDDDGIASCLAELAQVALRRDALTPAARMAGAAAGLWARLGTGLMAHDQARFDDLVARLRTALGTGYADLEAQGRAMTTQQAVTYALSAG